MGTEIELKLLVGAAELDALRAAPAVRAYAVGEPTTRHLSSRYFDTPNHELADAGVALRLRRIGDRVVQTVKGAQTDHAVERGEWEADLTDMRLDPSLVSEPALRARIATLADRLEEIFVTEFDRESTPLRLPGGTEIELAIDRGEVRAGDAAEPIHEVELELRDGDVADLWLLARWLHRTVAFRLGERSKAARGFALRTPHSPLVVKAPPVSLEASMSVEDAFKRIAATCLSHLRSNELAALHGADVGGVHQMRVSARRMRSATSLFRKALPRTRTRRLRRRLRWLAGELADARRWDVFATETLAGLRDRLDDDPTLDALASAVEEARAEAYERARTAVRSAAYTRLLLDAGHWLARDRWPVADDRSERLAAPIVPFAIAALDKRLGKVLDAGKRLRRLPPAKLHALRIELKKLRYAANFLGCLFSEKHAAKFGRAASDLQDDLGLIHDVAETPALLARLPGSDEPPLSRAIAAVAGWQAAAEARARRSLPKRWKALREHARFWAQAGN